MCMSVCGSVRTELWVVIASCFVSGDMTECNWSVMYYMRRKVFPPGVKVIVPFWGLPFASVKCRRLVSVSLFGCIDFVVWLY